MSRHASVTVDLVAGEWTPDRMSWEDGNDFHRLLRFWRPPADDPTFDAAQQHQLEALFSFDDLALELEFKYPAIFARARGERVKSPVLLAELKRLKDVSYGSTLRGQS